MIDVVVGDKDPPQAGGIDRRLPKALADPAGGNAGVDEQSAEAFPGGKIKAVAAAAAGERIKCNHDVTSVRPQRSAPRRNAKKESRSRTSLRPAAVL